MPPKKEQPRRSVLIAARLITLVVSLTGAEGVLWLGGYPGWWTMDPTMGGATAQYACDAELGWVAREGEFDLSWRNDRNPFRYTNWTGGRRATADREPAQEATSRRQVLFFGDSYIQGYGLSDSETLPWIVQKRHPNDRVSNFGAGAYGTYQSYLAMKKSVRGASSVYYLFNGFHESRNAGDPSWLRVFKRPPSGCFYPYAEISGGELREGRSEGDLVWPPSRHVRIMALVEEYKEIFESYLRVRNKRRVTEMIMVKMNEWALRAGGRFGVILFDMTPEEAHVLPSIPYFAPHSFRGLRSAGDERPVLAASRRPS